MKSAWSVGGWAALAGRLGDELADPATLAALQERLGRHGADLAGQIPELLLRGPDPEQAVQSWLADKDLSHWMPRSEGGTAADGWQFETATWNRSRGAEPMNAWEIGRAHLDGGLDALFVEGMPEAVGLACLESSLIAAVLSLAIRLHHHRQELQTAGPERRQALLQDAVRAAGLGALGGAGLSLVLSLALALVPGGQIWLVALTTAGVVRLLPGPQEDPFSVVPRGAASG